MDDVGLRGCTRKNLADEYYMACYQRILRSDSLVTTAGLSECGPYRGEHRRRRVILLRIHGSVVFLEENRWERDAINYLMVLAAYIILQLQIGVRNNFCEPRMGRH